MKGFIVLALTLVSLGVYGQGKEAWHWHLAENVALDFSSGTAVFDSVSSMIASEGSVTYSDQNGDLLFYSNGGNTSSVTSDGRIWKKDHGIMVNGHINNICGCTNAIQSSLVIPSPTTPDEYYMFTVDCYQAIEESKGLRYSIIDMTQWGGDGYIDQSEKGIPIYQDSTQQIGEGLTGTRHANGVDYWIVTKKILMVGSTEDEYYVFHISDQGITGPDTYTFPVSQVGIGSQLKISADGSKLGGLGYVYDFDNSTGQMSNPISLDEDGYGFCFSRSGNYAYVTNNFGIHQFDMNSATPGQGSTVIGPGLGGISSMQLGVDEKIYVRRAASQYLGVINNPDSPGLASNFDPNQLDLGVASGVSLPNYIDRDLFYSHQVSLSSDDEIEVKMYPNPTAGSVLLSSSGLLKERLLEIYTTQGQLIKHKSLHLDGFSEEFSLPSGVYFVLLSDRDGKLYFRKKLVVL